jgi:hypothetical protein
MHRRPIRRATILAITGVLILAGTAFADQLLADGDLATGGIQGTKFLGNVAPGAEVSADVEFTLTCVLLSHVNVGQTVNLTWSGLGSKPPGGEIVSVTAGSVGPVTITDGWAADGSGCPSPVPSLVGTVRSHVTLRAPTTVGPNYMYTIVYDRSLTPADPVTDGSAFSRTATQVSFTLNVVNTAPTLTVPASHSEEGNTTGGWIADWSGVSATDIEDDPDPTPSCNPPAGTMLLLDVTTTVTCSVTDSGGATTTRSFDVTVVDTTPPVLNGMPGDVSLTTGDPSGAVATYASPTASDIVDPSPSVQCAPSSGSTFPVGSNTVTCTATDGSGKSSSGTFLVTVDYVAPPNTAPTLTVPTSFVVEGNTVGGWLGPWTGVGATDVEDDPDPVPTCDPVAGTVSPVGTTTVSCFVTDSGGLTTSASFDATVTDTTAPILTNLPGDQTVPTADPTGTTLVYAPPSAADIVDSHPVAGCLPASGTHIGVGTTTVNCTVTDASGNTAHGSFDVTVVLVTQHTASAIWGEPIAGNETTFIANRGRTIPLKVELFVDGVAATSGDASVTLSPCATGSGLSLALTHGGGRWNASLDTSALDGSCYTVTASIDGLTAGAFRLEIRGDTASARAKPKAATTTTTTTIPPKVGPKKPR